MLQGMLIAESLRVDAELKIDGFRCRQVVRRDVSATTVSTQPGLWTFIDFEAPDEMADMLSAALAAALEKEGGWYADFVSRETITSSCSPIGFSVTGEATKPGVKSSSGARPKRRCSRAPARLDGLTLPGLTGFRHEI